MTDGIDSAQIVRTTTNDTRSFLFLTHTPRVVSHLELVAHCINRLKEGRNEKSVKLVIYCLGTGARPYCRGYLARFAMASSVAISATLRVSLISSPEILPL